MSSLFLLGLFIGLFHSWTLLSGDVSALGPVLLGDGCARPMWLSVAQWWGLRSHSSVPSGCPPDPASLCGSCGYCLTSFFTTHAWDMSIMSFRPSVNSVLWERSYSVVPPSLRVLLYWGEYVIQAYPFARLNNLALYIFSRCYMDMFCPLKGKTWVSAKFLYRMSAATRVLPEETYLVCHCKSRTHSRKLSQLHHSAPLPCGPLTWLGAGGGNCTRFALAFVPLGLGRGAVVGWSISCPWLQRES